MQMPMYPGMMVNQIGIPMQEQQLKDIHVPGVNDVMCGRGGGTNNHIGNIRFRQLVNGHKLRYLAATKSEKPMVSREVVTIWRGLNPPGRFLMQEKKRGDSGSGSNAGKWYDIGEKKAREKASQCLRERTPEVIPFVKKLELQLKLQQEEEAGVQDDRADLNSGFKSQTAAELSKELLHEQQQAAITAHMALKAYIPSSIMKLSQDVNLNNINNQGLPPNMHMAPMANRTNMSGPVQQHHSISSGHPAMTTRHVPSLPPEVEANISQQHHYFSVAYQKEQLAKEIEMLKYEQAKLEAEALLAERQAAIAVAAISEDILNELDVGSVEQGIEPIHPAEFANATMTKEEYRNSVRALLGPSSGHSSSGSMSTSMMDSGTAYSKMSGSDKKERMHSFDRSDFMETMSRGSWVRSVNTFDDVSMASPGSSVKMLNDLEPLDIRDRGFLNENGVMKNNTDKSSDKSVGKASLSIYESQILENLISPANTDFDRFSGLPNIKEDASASARHMPPPPPSQPRPIVQPHSSQGQLMGHGNQSNHHRSAHRSAHQQHHSNGSRIQMAKGVSAVSMISDLSDFSNKSMSMNARIAKMKSDPSLFNDNMSDLSEAMGSLDVSTTKSFKE